VVDPWGVARRGSKSVRFELERKDDAGRNVLESLPALRGFIYRVESRLDPKR
jgi:hypothetical protein